MRVIVSVGCIFLAFAAAIFYLEKPLVLLMSDLFAASPRTYTIEMSERGFEPREITIRKGDTVIFKNTGTIALWPASDPHPTHENVSGFDAKKGIAPGESWSYVFNEDGGFRYHDHMSVTSRGEVIVRGRSSRADPALAGEICNGVCFDELVRATVKAEGIDAAYALFQNAYEKGSLPRSCHWTAHQIGEAAYELFKEGKDFPISHATSYCAYGFYHGFLESLLRENPSPAYALAFCKKVAEKLGEMGLWNCYHGIGHGYTEDPPPPETIGKFDAMIAPGIKMCEFLFGNDFRNLNLCLTGVYTVPAGFAEKKEFGLSIDKNDVFKYCKDQPYRYQKACYGEFAPKLDSLLEWDVRNLPAIIDSIPDDKLKRLVTWVVPSVMVAYHIQKDDYSNYINGCRESFTGNLREICWGGTLLGFFTHGEPEKQYKKVIAFCSSGAWKTSDERILCWREGFRQMRMNYSLDKVKQICGDAPEEFRLLCLDPEGKIKSPYDDPTFD